MTAARNIWLATTFTGASAHREIQPGMASAEPWPSDRLLPSPLCTLADCPPNGSFPDKALPCTAFRLSARLPELERIFRSGKLLPKHYSDAGPAAGIETMRRINRERRDRQTVSDPGLRISCMREPNVHMTKHVLPRIVRSVMKRYCSGSHSHRPSPYNGVPRAFPALSRYR